MKTLLALLTFISFSVSAQTVVTVPQPSPTATALPNNCVLLAIQARAQLAPHVWWVRILMLQATRASDNTKHFHAIVVFQIFPGGALYYWDQNGAREIKTHSEDLAEITPAIQATLLNGYTITESHFAE